MAIIPIIIFVIIFSPFFTGSKPDAQSTSNVNTNNRPEQVPNSVKISPQDPRRDSGSYCPPCGRG